jgi:23S rRNA (uracil1939-C5)-methyltransferase
VVTLAVEKPAAGGRMIARHDGAIALVAGAIPGEIVEARVERIQRRTIWARTTRVVTASPDRIAAAGTAECGGAVFAHVGYERQLALKADILRDGFTRIGKLPVPEPLMVVASPRVGYRMRARLHVQQGRIGFFREGTHTLCDPATTAQLLPATLATLTTLEAALAAHPGHGITDVELSENRAATARAVHLELKEGTDPAQLTWLPDIDGVTGISAAVATGFRTETLSGTPLVTDTLTVPTTSGPIRYTLQRHARSFFQGNRFLLESLVGRVLDAIPAGRVLDLYAGVGLFSLAAAVRGGAEVLAVEGDRWSAADLKENAVQAATAIDARHQAVETFLDVERDRRWSSIVVDPPRTGMTKEALGGVIDLAASRIVYVSCDVATLARDARRLIDAGYGLRSLEAFDLFPDTAHVESVAVFDR